jgi:hypothetical protein
MKKLRDNTNPKLRSSAKLWEKVLLHELQNGCFKNKKSNYLSLRSNWCSRMKGDAIAKLLVVVVIVDVCLAAGCGSFVRKSRSSFVRSSRTQADIIIHGHGSTFRGGGGGGGAGGGIEKKILKKKKNFFFI